MLCSFLAVALVPPLLADWCHYSVTRMCLLLPMVGVCLSRLITVLSSKPYIACAHKDIMDTIQCTISLSFCCKSNVFL
ncbi:hypothetical protein NC652_038388 [Populus alba x Populus x berolinensis]|uniref:Secreted protein n=1 Tax=Populus alba x Populus x berolinensis TaxID=444605 RepID=A0AAD6LGS7_9ROSI|nr:hypothetical protein NC652_038388 [Populus alba x Populus x berolinensis]KAJ6960338.1 hypothetical protein NC653_038386 [Populus alba x Populus x berolinensis]